MGFRCLANRTNACKRTKVSLPQQRRPRAPRDSDIAKQEPDSVCGECISAAYESRSIPLRPKPKHIKSTHTYADQRLGWEC